MKLWFKTKVSLTLLGPLKHVQITVTITRIDSNVLNKDEFCPPSCACRHMYETGVKFFARRPLYYVRALFAITMQRYYAFIDFKVSGIYVI